MRISEKDKELYGKYIHITEVDLWKQHLENKKSSEPGLPVSGYRIY